MRAAKGAYTRPTLKPWLSTENRTAFSTFLEARSRGFWSITGFALILLIGALDYLTGFEVSFSLFYLVPIALGTWFAGRRTGLVLSVVSALTWFVADTADAQRYTFVTTGYWNAYIRLSFFVVVTFLLAALRRAFRRISELTRLDPLTGALNSRAFTEQLQIEAKRAERYGHPFTLAYIDLDNFKRINDSRGHLVGDEVLRSVVTAVFQCVRVNDSVGRLGGDEFALLLPETDAATAQNTVKKIQDCLLTEMARRGWPVTFSIGVVTRRGGRGDVSTLLCEADALMYEVKRETKNGVRYSKGEDSRPSSAQGDPELQSPF